MIMPDAAHPNNISIHSLREEGDRPAGHPAESPAEFLSTPSARRATTSGVCFSIPFLFLSTPSARRATTDADGDTLTVTEFLSTPSARRATLSLPPSAVHLNQFLSTPSARRATSGWRPRPPWRCNFYPRPPRGGRHNDGSCQDCAQQISIHALREEGDQKLW